MNREVKFYQEIVRDKPNLEDIKGPDQAEKVSIFLGYADELSTYLEMENMPQIALSHSDEPGDTKTVREKLYLLDCFLARLYARNIGEFQPETMKEFVVLDKNWKQKVSSYIANIRKHVEKAEIEEGLRERIFKKLSELQKEVDRNRTRVEVASEVLATLTEAMGKSAQNLRPAVALMERITGSIRILSRETNDPEATPQIPGPEEYGLTSRAEGNHDNEEDSTEHS